MTNARNARAGALQAGDAIDKPADDLLGLLESITTTRAGVAALDALNAQLADAENAVGEHAAGAEAAQLHGEEAEQQHAAQAGVLDRRVSRIRLAIDRATERLAVVAEQERRASGEAAAERAEKQAGVVENLVGEYVAAARAVGELLDKIAAESDKLERDRAAARAAGVECDAQLPHEARFVPERTETREVTDRQRGAGVYDASGTPVDGRPVQQTETRRTETVVVQRRHAPQAVAVLRAVLPGPDGAPLVDRNRD
jgi:hypothetical protein